MNSMIMVLGGGIMQLPLIQSARSMGYPIIVADGNKDCYGRIIADIFLWIDIKAHMPLIAAAQQIHKTKKIAVVMTAATDFSLNVARLNAALNIKQITVETAYAATNKYRMRTVLKRHALATPRFLRLTKNNRSQLQNLSPPIVIKPVDSMGARGVVRIEDVHGGAQWIEQARDISQDDTVIAEEFIDGQEYSLDALVYNNKIYWCGLAQRIIKLSPWFVELGHTIPAQIPHTIRRALLREAAKAIRAIAINHGAVKIDIFHTARGVVVGEIAARLSGGFMSGWTYPLSHHRNVSQMALSVALRSGRRPVSASARQIAAERSIISIPGIAQAVRGISEARSIHGVTHVFQSVTDGMRVQFPQNNLQKCVHIIVSAATMRQIDAITQRARTAIDIRLQPGNSDTLAFLFGHSGAQYPAAYAALPTTLIEQLQQMPISLPTAEQQPIATVPQLSTPVFDWHAISFTTCCAIIMREYRIHIGDTAPTLTRPFWRSIFKGGLQGARFFIDTLRAEYHLLQEWVAKWNGNILD